LPQGVLKGTGYFAPIGGETGPLKETAASEGKGKENGRLADRGNPTESAEIKSHRSQSKYNREIHACLGSTSGRLL
jgi:hypothetical protein